MVKAHSPRNQRTLDPDAEKTNRSAAMKDANTLRRELDQQIDLLPEEHVRAVLDFARSLRKTQSPSRPSIAEKIEALVQDVPSDVWDEVPTDGAEQHDHYIYGTPKRKG